MIDRQYVLTVLRDNMEDIRSQYNVSKIGLFGSFARDEATELSDVDLIVEFEGNVDLYETKIALKKFLKQKLNRNVDICRAKYLKSFVKKRILEDVLYV